MGNSFGIFGMADKDLGRHQRRRKLPDQHGAMKRSSI